MKMLALLTPTAIVQPANRLLLQLNLLASLNLLVPL